MLKTALALIGLVILGFVAYIRVAPNNPPVWHVDPMTATKPRSPNAFIMRPGEGKYPSPVFSTDALTLARAFDAKAMATADVTRLSGAPEELFITYIARTRLMRYPDFISIRFIDQGDGKSTLAVFSRARFGYSDRGVNRKRVLVWLKTLDFS